MLTLPDHKSKILTIIAVLTLIGMVLRIVAFDPFNIVHPDELMQYLEQGNRLATGQGIVPWEYRYGARNALIPQFLMLPMWLGHWLAPGTLAPMLLARLSFMAACLAVLPAAWQLGRLTSNRHAVAALFVAATWYESVLFGDFLLSESLATALLLPAAALLLQHAPVPRSLRLAGLLLGLGVLVRLQYGVFAAVLAMLALGTDWRRWSHVLAGAGGAALLGAISDLANGTTPFVWIITNLSMNIGDHRAAGFGVSSVWDYGRLLLLHLGPAAIPIIALSAFAGRRYRPLLLANVANFLVHSAIGHKEYRFIWLTCLSILLLAAIASVRLADHVVQQRREGKAINIAGVACLCAIWLGLSSLAQAQSGGARALRWGGELPLMANVAAAQGTICGLAVPDQWRAHLVPALLPRPVPLYVAPHAIIADHALVPADLEGAANAMILPAGTRFSQPFLPSHCQRVFSTRSCLFTRPGKCTPAPRWSYQSVLRREDS